MEEEDSNICASSKVQEMEEQDSNTSTSSKLQEIREDAFRGCSSLQELDLSSLHDLTSIDDAAFLGCSALTTIKMAPNLVAIGIRAFSGCQVLREIHWNGVLLTELKADLFSNCPQLTCLDLSHLTQLRVIGNCVFKGCTGLKFVKFPSTLESIEVGAFYGCESLKEIEFASESTASTRELQIGQAAFAKCSALTTFDLPQYVTRLAPLIFWGCSSLERVNIRPTLESIGGSALGLCVSLKEITLPSTMKEESIGPNAFFKCPNDLGTDVWHWQYPRHENDYEQEIFEDGRQLPSEVTKVKLVSLDDHMIPSHDTPVHPNGKNAFEWVDLESSDLLSAIQLSLTYPKATALTLTMPRLIRMYHKAPICRSEISAEIDRRRSRFYSQAFMAFMFDKDNDHEKRNVMNKFGEIQRAHASTIHQLVSRRVGLEFPLEPFAFMCER